MQSLKPILTDARREDTTLRAQRRFRAIVMFVLLTGMAFAQVGVPAGG